ncbi:DUF4328 domain-containing protein [Carboxylicivirga sp. N1Y90]|uniref:DUF4328 domain-containing protein n=1 Tax=Carboxylicivirga fragile TaxID=3417571 RepID=UPI003D33FCA7|nr:DUF4328 domain-containing protein [Marinilabiliaceae bacterium N1Y90]
MIENSNELLKDNSQRAKITERVFIFLGITTVFAVVSNVMEHNLLQDLKGGLMYDDSQLEMSDLRQGIIGLVQTGLTITSVVVFLGWFRRAYGNLHRSGIRNITYSETMTNWSFVIPFINLYRPYQIMKELLQEMKRVVITVVPSYRLQISSGIIGMWWTVYIIRGILGQIAFRSSLRAETVFELSNSSMAFIISDTFDIIAIIVTILMVKQVSKEEEMFAESLKVAKIKIEESVEN